MTSSTAFISRYDRRVTRAQEVLKQHTKLTDAECREIAVRLLHTLDTIPEKVR